MIWPDEGLKLRRNTCLYAGAVAVAPVDNAAVLVQPDGFAQAMIANIRNEVIELGALHEREEVGDGMKVPLHRRNA